MSDQRIKEMTRKNFTEAFWLLYEKKDIKKISVNEICQLAGYHRNSFYRYFSDVYDVLEQIEDHVIDDILLNTDSGLVLGDPYETADRYLKIWKENERYLRVFADERRSSSFQAKMTARLKEEHMRLFLYSEDAELDDYIWEYNMTGAVAAMLYYFRKEEHEMGLDDVIILLMGFRDTVGYSLKIREDKK